jgi:putative hydrolase of HD superfamily
MNEDHQPIVNFLFEAGMLQKTPRSGFFFLGSGEQSVAEHTHRVIMIGYTLALLDGKVDTLKILKMCLLHDLPEARTSDFNYVHQKYAKAEEQKAIDDLSQTLPFGDDIKAILAEYNERKSQESLYAKDADQLEHILSLKEQMDIGNTRAQTWIPSGVKRLKTNIAHSLAEKIISTDSDEWWFSHKDDTWWINRNNTK